MVRVGIAGGSGYGGAELIHVLLRHPHVEPVWVSSQHHVGRPVGEVYPNLRGLVTLTFSSLEELPGAGLDTLFLALPHGQAMKIVPRLPAGLRVIDLSGDFRIGDAECFEKYYGFPLLHPELQREFVYGLPEVNRERIRKALRIANPGCFATAVLLALHPLFESDWLAGTVFVDAKTGSSGAGAAPGAGTHHPRRSNSFFPYKPFRHQHFPEIVQLLGPDSRLVLQTYSAPFVRGIFASHYMKLRKSVSQRDVEDLYQLRYGAEPFIRWVPGGPDVNYVRHSNFVDIGAAVQDEFLIVWSALDNLQKGAAGQAVQNFNLMLGFPEDTALRLAPPHP